MLLAHYICLIMIDDLTSFKNYFMILVNPVADVISFLFFFQILLLQQASWSPRVSLQCSNSVLFDWLYNQSCNRFQSACPAVDPENSSAEYQSNFSRFHIRWDLGPWNKYIWLVGKKTQCLPQRALEEKFLEEALQHLIVEGLEIVYVVENLLKVFRFQWFGAILAILK